MTELSLKLNLPLVVGPTADAGVLQQIGFSNASVKPALSEEQNFLLSFHRGYREVVISLQASIAEVAKNSLPNEDENDQFLIIKPPSSSKLKLGNHVKIRKEMKRRQLKQVLEAAGWSESMKADYGKVGTVVGIQTANPRVAIVYFKGSDRCWTIDARAVDVVEGYDEVHEQATQSNVKVDDFVEIERQLPNDVLDTTQAIYSLTSENLKQFRNQLIKVLAFKSDGVAIVSINEYESILVNPQLLKKAAKPCNQLHQKKAIAKDFPLGKEYTIRHDLENLIKLNFWQVPHTEILGKKATIENYVDELLIVKVDNNFYHITKDFLDLKKREKVGKGKKKPRSRNPTGETLFQTSSKFPFKVDQIVRLQLANPFTYERSLRNIEIPVEFISVLREEFGVVRGYNRFGKVAVDFGWPSARIKSNFSTKRGFFIPIKLLRLVSDEEKLMYGSQIEKRQKIKVGDTISLLVAKYQSFVNQVLDSTVATQGVRKAMTSTAKLLAFDDDKDTAIFQLKNGKVFACPSDYIIAAAHHDSLTKQVSAKSFQAYTKEINGFPLTIFETAFRIISGLEEIFKAYIVITSFDLEPSGSPVVKMQFALLPPHVTLQVIANIVMSMIKAVEISIDAKMRICCTFGLGTEMIQDCQIILDIAPFSTSAPIDNQNRVEQSSKQLNQNQNSDNSVATKAILDLTTATLSDKVTEPVGDLDEIQKSNELGFTLPVESEDYHQVSNSIQDCVKDELSDEINQETESATSSCWDSPEATTTRHRSHEAEADPITSPQPAQGDLEIGREGSSRDGTIEKSATMKFNPHTKEFTITGNISGFDLNRPPSSVPLNRQNSYNHAPEPAERFGGNHVTNNYISHCNIGAVIFKPDDNTTSETIDYEG